MSSNQDCYITETAEQRRYLYNAHSEFRDYNFRNRSNSLDFDGLLVPPQTGDSDSGGLYRDFENKKIQKNTFFIQNDEKKDFYVQKWHLESIDRKSEGCDCGSEAKDEYIPKRSFSRASKEAEGSAAPTNKNKFSVPMEKIKIGESKGFAPKAIVFFIHGFGSSVIFNNEVTSKSLCAQNYLVFGMDGFGHGLSEGLHGYVPDFNKYVDDYYDVYTQIAAMYPKLKKHLLSVSMGGAVSMHILHRDLQNTPRIFSGSIFLSPMVKIAPEMIPNRVAYFFFQLGTKLLPRAKLTPTNDLKSVCFYNKDIAEYFDKNQIFYKDKIRLGTSKSLLLACDQCSKMFETIETPFLVMHGEDDKLTSPDGSKEFFEKAKTSDKTLKLYEREMHALLMEDRDCEVFGNLLSWLEERV